jgi:hypothetical protein
MRNPSHAARRERRFFDACVSSPGLAGRFSNHQPGMLDCPVKPGNGTPGVNPIEKRKTENGNPHKSNVAGANSSSILTS